MPGVEEEGAVPGMYMTMEEIEAVLVASPSAFSPPAAFLEGICIFIEFSYTLYPPFFFARNPDFVLVTGLLDEGVPFVEVSPPTDIVEVEPPRTVSKDHMPVLALPPIEASSSSAACASSGTHIFSSFFSFFFLSLFFS